MSEMQWLDRGPVETFDWAYNVSSAEALEQEDVLDWLRGIGAGAATGAATGAVGGPFGALIGGLMGAGLGAAQTAQQQRRPVTTVPASSAPAGGASAPAAGGHPTAATASPTTIDLLRQLTQLLPQLIQLLAQPPRAGRAVESLPQDEDDLGVSDYILDKIPFYEDDRISSAAGWGRDDDDITSIEEPIPDDGELPEREDFAEDHLAPEYPQASRFEPAATVNYHHPYRSPRTITRIVIHITDGGPRIDNTIRRFQNPHQTNRKGEPIHVSAHYIVGRDGEVVQMVRHNDVAHHADGANRDSIGIEHNANTRGLYPTPAQYASSAALVRWLCAQYGIPMDRAHILGHVEADPQTTHKGCPNAVWDWDYYMSLVTAGTGNTVAPTTAPTGPLGTGEEVEWGDDLGLPWNPSESVIDYPVEWSRTVASARPLAFEWTR